MQDSKIQDARIIEDKNMKDNKIRLGDLAHARSGDKGNRANIGVVADEEKTYQWLKEHLTAEGVAEYLKPLEVGKVERFELPKIRALNFVIDKALGGGASRSLRFDSQGKALGVALLEMKIPARRIDRHERTRFAGSSRYPRADRRLDARSRRETERIVARVGRRFGRLRSTICRSRATSAPWS